MARWIGWSWPLACLAWACVLVESAAAAEEDARPPAHRMLPSTTFGFLRIADAPELVEKLKQTAIGQIAQDEEVSPLLSQLYGDAREAYGNVEDEVGVALDDLLKLPQGEVVFAVVDMQSGPPAFVVLMDVGEEQETVETLLERLDEALTRDGGKPKQEKIRSTEVTLYEGVGADNATIAVVLRDNTLMMVTHRQLTESLLTVWDGQTPDPILSEIDEEDGEAAGWTSLAENPEFAAIMQKCVPGDDLQPQVSWFIDPFAIVDIAARDNAGTAFAQTILINLGVDGVEGVGGTTTLATEEYDSVSHIHILMKSPREGVMEAIAMQSGSLKPEPFIPADAASYTTLYWDFDRTYNVASEYYNQFRGDGALAQEMEKRIGEPLGVDFEEDILSALDGRVTFMQWFEPEASFVSQATLVAVKLRDPEKTEATLQQVIQKFDERFETKKSGGVTYYEGSPPESEFPEPEDAEPAEEEPEEELTPQQQRRRRFRAQFRNANRGCFAILGKYLVVTNRTSLMEKAIATTQQPANSLAESAEYILIAKRMERIVGDNRPGLVTFQRPEQGMRWMYDMLNDDDNQAAMAQAAENNPFFRAISQGLEDNPLPPFSVIKRRLAPGGALMTNDESGFHYMQFNLRPEAN